jgi:hypothetical protein
MALSWVKAQRGRSQAVSSSPKDMQHHCLSFIPSLFYSAMTANVFVCELLKDKIVFQKLLKTLDSLAR